MASMPSPLSDPLTGHAFAVSSARSALPNPFADCACRRRGIGRPGVELLAPKSVRIPPPRRTALSVWRMAAVVAKAGADSSPSAAQETLETLGWWSLCDSVAGFASTAAGKNLCRKLTLPGARGESQALLDETSAALEADAVVPGLFDFGALRSGAAQSGVDKVARGTVPSGKELAAIATLLQIAQTLRQGMSVLLAEDRGGGEGGRFGPLARWVESVATHPELCEAIRARIDGDGTVKDSASARVRQARIQVRTAELRLREWFEKLVREKSSGAEGVSEIVEFDGRMCLLSTSGGGRGSSIPGLVVQRSGASAYLEPSQAVPLNNRLAEARAEVESAEYEVLTEIAAKLMPRADDVRWALHCVAQLDVIAARGKFSSWIGGRMPQLVDGGEAGDAIGRDGGDGSPYRRYLVHLRKARHPALVTQHRQAVATAKAKLKSKQSSRLRSRGVSAGANAQDASAGLEEAEMEVAVAVAAAPVPIDVRIARGVRVVAVTGPNTGGKTAAIKAVGLAVLMARAGLYVVAADPVVIPWFDAVFADVGDEQSLGQSLSTFSGHMLRIKRIMEESTSESLVLLDELGAGTDPTEGAALAMALLESFAGDGGKGGCLLTLITTHHGELKTLKYSDGRFENASVEFDEERLAPTYKLLWGIPGRSNALNIARRLGLPGSILCRAETLYGTATAEVNEVIMSLEGAKLAFDRDMEESEGLTREVKEYYSQLVESAGRLQERKQEFLLDKREQLTEIARSAHSALRVIAKKNAQGASLSREAKLLADVDVETNEPPAPARKPYKSKKATVELHELGSYF